jgi:energy-converting hydrogenase Eha subunit F
MYICTYVCIYTQALLQWAYYEATSLVRQYGDLLEEVNSYLATGTSTVGECVVLVEEELR